MKKFSLSINIPTSWEDIRDVSIRLFKWVKNPIRRNHNEKVMSELLSEINGELRSGYWDNDISDTMRKSLVYGSPGKIQAMVNKAYRKLK